MEPQVLSAIIAGAVSLLISTVVATWSQRKKLETDYDVTLRTERLTEYRKLWQIMEPIGWYGEHEITSDTAKKILGDLDHWYFENGGGLFLSDVSYSSFEELLRVLNTHNGQLDALRSAGSKLRTSLVYDIGGRKRPLLRPHVRQKDLERTSVINSRLSSR